MASALLDQENVNPGIAGGVVGTSGDVGGDVGGHGEGGVVGRGDAVGNVPGVGVPEDEAAEHGKLSQEFRKLSASQSDFDESNDDWMLTQTGKPATSDTGTQQTIPNPTVSSAGVGAENVDSDGGKTGSGGEWSVDDDDFMKLAQVKEGSEIFSQRLEGPQCKIARIETLDSSKTTLELGLASQNQTSTQKPSAKESDIPQAVLEVCSSYHGDDDDIEILGEEAKKLLFNNLDKIIEQEIVEPNSGEALCGNNLISYQMDDLVAEKDDDDFGGDIYQGQENECYSSDEELYETVEETGSIFENDQDGKDVSRALDRPATPPTEAVKKDGVASADATDNDRPVNDDPVGGGGNEALALVGDDVNDGPVIHEGAVGGGEIEAPAVVGDGVNDVPVIADEAVGGGVQIGAPRLEDSTGIPGLPGFSSYDQRGRSESYVNNQLSTMKL